MVPPCRRPWPPSPSPKKPSSAIKYLSRAYLNVSDCVTHIWPIPMVCNDILCDVPERDPPRTYVHTYSHENRSSIQSLALMCSAAILWLQFYDVSPVLSCWRHLVTTPVRSRLDVTQPNLAGVLNYPCSEIPIFLTFLDGYTVNQL